MSFCQFRSETYKSIPYRLGIPAQKQIERTGENIPLIVYLHGAGERGKDNKSQLNGLNYLGNGLSFTALKFRKKYTSFIYVPQCPCDKEWTDEMIPILIETIKSLYNKYPINQKRLYLIGYSMGGSGTFNLASEFYNATGLFFTAIVRIAGQSFFIWEIHKIIYKSSVWLHIGLKDNPLRIRALKESYRYLKEIALASDIDYSEGMIKTCVSMTRFVHKMNIEKIKLSEYKNYGHGISLLPFKKNSVIEWLFYQRSDMTEN